MKPLRICYVIPNLDLGGSESHLVGLAQGLRGRGHQAEIACVFAEGALGPAARDQAVPVKALEIKTWGIQAMAAIYRHLASFRPDILHTYLFGLHFFAGLPGRLLNVPVICSSRRDVELSQTQKVLRMERLGNLFVDHVVCCSQAVETWVLGRENLKPNQLSNIYNGIDAGGFQPKALPAVIRHEFGIPPQAPVIGTVANFSPKKGYPYLLEAAQTVLKQSPGTYFLLVGFGPLEGEMKQRVQESPFAKKIIFTGCRKDIPALIQVMDIFIFSSLWEGLPNAVLEAMTLGRPVISTRVGGVPEIIKDGENGILVPTRDVSAFAKAMLDLLNHPEQAREMGEKAREKILRDFTIGRMLDDYERLYRVLLAKKDGTGPVNVPDKKPGDSTLQRERRIESLTR